MIFWHASLVGWMVCRKQGVEKTVEFASAYETDVADLHGPIWSLWSWLPQGMSIRRILDGKLFAEDVVVCHRESSLTPVGARRGVLGRQTCPTTHARQCSPPKMAARPAPAASAN